MKRYSTTILIPARNASGTIARAMRSALAQDVDEILLLDHSSTDGTVERGREIAGERLRVVRVPASRTLGGVRQAGLDAIVTDFGVWLDADDELVPGRATALVGLLEAEESELAFDEIYLHDGATGALLRRITIPPFLENGSAVARCFERNYLPGLGVPAFRTSFARLVGYDEALHGAEDYDFLLRSVVARGRIALLREPYYRQFSYRGSVSRHLDNQRRMCGQALRKHDPSVVELVLKESGLDDAQCRWTLICVHVFCCRYDLALATLLGAHDGSELLRGSKDQDWTSEFQRGTLLLMLDRLDEAEVWLRRATARCERPECLNNLGVALAVRGARTEAGMHFEKALRMYPEYNDARLNAADPTAKRITLLPLRVEPSRSDYSAAAADV